MIFTACTTHQSIRGPATQDPSGPAHKADKITVRTEKDIRAQYYISSFPADKQSEFTLELKDMDTISDQCRSGNLAVWMSPAATTRLQAEKENTLSMELNRPFYFQLIQGQDRKIHFVGSLSDFKALICISLALADGQIGSATTKLSPKFFDTISKLPNINFQVLQLLFSEWQKTNLDLNSGVSIIQSKTFDHYLATDILNSIFKKKDNADNRVKLVQEILNTQAFSAHSSELSQSILRESNKFVLPEERIKIAEALLGCGRDIDKNSTLNYLLYGIQQEQDYTLIFKRLTAGASAKFQFDAFRSILNSGGKIQNPETIFLTLWSARSTDLPTDPMISFAISDWKKQLWLSHQTIASVISEGLTKKLAPSILDNIIHFLTFTNSIDPNLSVSFLDLIIRNQELNSTRVHNIINAAYDIRNNAATMESQLTPIVLQARGPFSAHSEINDAFFRYIKWMNDLPKKISLVAKFMETESINEDLLISIAKDAYSIKLDSRIQLLSEIIKQSSITDLGLGTMVGLLSSPFKISDAERSVLLQIKANPKASSATLQRINRVLNPNWEIIQDPMKY